MYQALIRGTGKRLQAETLIKLIEKLSREDIRLNDSELIMRKERMEKGLPVDILATRKLTRGELIKKSLRPPYLGNPFRQIPDTENVCLRITYVGKQKREDDFRD